MISYRGSPINSALNNQIKGIFPTLWVELIERNSPKYQTAIKLMSIGKMVEFNETIGSILQSAFCIMMGSTHGSNSTQLYLSVLFDLYKGKIPYSVAPEMRLWFQQSQRKAFRIVCVEAVRYTFKYLYDASVLGEPIEDGQELYNSLDEMTSNWIATVDPVQQIVDDPTQPAKEIQEGLENGIRGVFQLFLKKQGEPLRVRMLTKSDSCVVKIAKLNQEALMVQ